MSFFNEFLVFGEMKQTKTKALVPAALMSLSDKCSGMLQPGKAIGLSEDEDVFFVVRNLD